MKTNPFFNFCMLCIAATTNQTGLLQDLVTWDEYSVFVRGERIILLSGEFQPYRLPSPGLWLDIFQKVRALGYSAVSFYLDWALLEHEPGHVRIDGVFDLPEFFDAASEAGIYLIARPGPYINSEVSGGGFPGWLTRIPGRYRTAENPDYIEAITPYIKATGESIAKGQITNGGPVILFQPENELTLCVNTTGYTQLNNMTVGGIDSSCLSKEYMAYVEEKYREAGIVVPYIINDAFSVGNFAPGTGLGAGDIYSFDHYPLGWAVAPPDSRDWSELLDPLRLYNFTLHERISPNSPMAISEFQGGVPDPWGGPGVEQSAAHINSEFVRVFYKINYGMRITIQNLYMLFGGTNWGNLGHPGGHTSYDVGAGISENRLVHREKYSEMKLQAAFLQVSPAYLTSHPDNGTFGVYTDTRALVVTRLTGSPTDLYIVRHSNMTSLDNVKYRLRVSSSIGNLTLPQTGGRLSLNGRDSKFHVVDYDVGGINLIYSTAEIFTWKKSSERTVLVLYGGENELHEFALPTELGAHPKIEGKGVKIHKKKSAIVVRWSVQPERRTVTFGDDLEVHLVWRNEAYNYWLLDLPAPEPLGLYASPNRADKSVIVKAGYLLRNASISGETLRLSGDINCTTEIELISAPTKITSLEFNGQKVKTSARSGRLLGTVKYNAPDLGLPDLGSLEWRYIDSLPELEDSYDDSAWTPCDQTTTNNPRNLSTPTSLYASDYGYHSGSLLYRGSFIADGSESSIYLLTEGGFAYGHSVWLNSTYLGSWTGSAADMFYNQTLPFPEELEPGSPYVITVLIDHMGLDLNFPSNLVTLKDPRGILDYNWNRDKEAISWKLTGNLGGEQYLDYARGPLNEGSLYAERQGLHLPGAPVDTWEKQSPLEGLSKPGVGFFVTEFDLDIPAGYDVPISVVYTNSTKEGSSDPSKLRSQLFVNGWQFGKYINHIGPQKSFPAPEGILNYNGPNTLALSVWSMEPGTVKLDGIQLEADAVLQSAYQKPEFVAADDYSKREGAY
ncbi:beta-galactosidase [Aspergillus varians]